VQSSLLTTVRDLRLATCSHRAKSTAFGPYGIYPCARCRTVAARVARAMSHAPGSYPTATILITCCAAAHLTTALAITLAHQRRWLGLLLRLCVVLIYAFYLIYPLSVLAFLVKRIREALTPH